MREYLVFALQLQSLTLTSNFSSCGLAGFKEPQVSADISPHHRQTRLHQRDDLPYLGSGRQMSYRRAALPQERKGQMMAHRDGAIDEDSLHCDDGNKVQSQTHLQHTFNKTSLSDKDCGDTARCCQFRQLHCPRRVHAVAFLLKFKQSLGIPA